MHAARPYGSDLRAAGLNRQAPGTMERRSLRRLQVASDVHFLCSAAVNRVAGNMLQDAFC